LGTDRKVQIGVCFSGFGGEVRTNSDEFAWALQGSKLHDASFTKLVSGLAFEINFTN